MLKTTPLGDVTRLDLARTLAGRGYYWTTAYLVDDLLIDTGCAHCADELVPALAEAEISTVVNTHTHEDHIGANARLQRNRAELVIRAHPRALALLADPRGQQPLHPYRRLMWGWPEPSTATALDDGEEIKTRRRTLQVLYTPGHSSDHLCLFAPREGWLFTGDLYVGGTDRALRAGYDIWQIISSLRSIAALGATIMYPGSAKIRDNPEHALGAKIEHLERLGEKVLELDRRGAGVKTIARRLCGPPMPIEWLTLGHFSRRNLVRSYLGQNRDW